MSLLFSLLKGLSFFTGGFIIFYFCFFDYSLFRLFYLLFLIMLLKFILFYFDSSLEEVPKSSLFLTLFILFLYRDFWANLLKEDALLFDYKVSSFDLEEL